MVEVFHVLPNFFPNTLDVIKHLDISILTPLNSDNKSTTSLRTFCTQFFPCDAVEFEKLGPITCCYLKLSKIAMDFTSTSLWASILFSVHPLPYLRQDPIFGLVLNSTGTSEIIYVVHNVSSTEQIEESFRRVDLPTSFPCIEFFNELCLVFRLQSKFPNMNFDVVNTHPLQLYFTFVFLYS